MDKEKYLNEYIMNIVQKYKIEKQSQLKDHLLKKGYNIPQATLSRKMKQLSIVKVSGIYTTINYSQSSPPAIIDIKISDSGIVILHTKPGHASSLAFFLDKKYLSYFSRKENDCLILGTIAGDDTVLLILKNNTTINNVISLIKKDCYYIGDI